MHDEYIHVNIYKHRYIIQYVHVNIYIYYTEVN